MRKPKIRRLSPTQKNMVELFYILFLGLGGLSVIAAMISGGETLRHTFFFTYNSKYQMCTTDAFMDFFNSVRDASHNGGYEKGVIYPPLANLIFFLFGKMMYADYVGETFTNRFSLRNYDPNGLLVYFVFVTLCLFMTFLVIDRRLRSQNFKFSPALMALFGTFSFPMLYGIQRGNIIILAVPLTMFFVFYRNSKKKWIRELSYIALALAAAVKIYPAVFGVLLITDKKYKEALRTVAYGIALFILPVFAFDGGLDLIRQLVENIVHFSGQKASSVSKITFRSGYAFQTLANTYFTTKLTSILGKLIFICIELLSFMMAFMLPKEWQKVTCICYALFNIQSFSGNYALVFFLLPFIMFITERKRFRWNDIVFLLCMMMMFIVLPCFWYQGVVNASWSSDAVCTVAASLKERTRAAFIDHYVGVNKLISPFAFHSCFLLLIYDAWTTVDDKAVNVFKKKNKPEPISEENADIPAEEQV